MFSQLIQFSLSQRLMMCLLSIVLIGFGTKALLELPIDAFPDISPTQVKIIIKAPGMTPEEVEALITQPLEVELLGIPQQAMLRSVAKYALTDITLDFEDGTDIYWARQQVSERINNIWNDLPVGIDGGLAPMSTPLGDMFMFTVESDLLTLEEKRFLLDWTIRPALRTVPGVADLNALGGFVKTYQVAPLREAMTNLAVSNDAIISALESNNRNDGAGRIDQGEEAILIRVEDAISTLADIENTLVENTLGEKLPLSEVAHISLGTLERYGSVTANGAAEAVQGLVIGLRGANARDVVAGVRAKLDELEATFPTGTHTEIFYDRGVLIEETVSTVIKALLEAVVLVIILLILFLGNVRAALTVAVVLPLSALCTFLAMNTIGMSANLMSLGGLVIAIGMLVDSSIVIVENIVSALSQQKSEGRQLPRLHIIFRAVKDVAVPVSSGVVIIVIVFLPLLTLESLEGKLFGPVALTIVFALLGALILSLTVIPVIASYLISSEQKEEPWLSRKLTVIYRSLLAWVLNKPKILIGFSAILLLASASVFPLVGKTFMPTMDEGDIIIQLELIPSINLNSTTNMVLKVEQALLAEVPEITKIISRSGSDELGMDPMSLNETDMFLELKPPSQWRMGSKSELESSMRLVMDQFRGINYGFTMPIDMRVSEMLTGSRGDVAIKLFGPELDTLNTYIQDIAQVIEGIQGSVDTIASINEGAQYLQVKVDRYNAGLYGIDGDDLQIQLRSEIEGLRIGTVIEKGARVPLVVRYEKLEGDAFENISNRFINLENGNSVPITELASIQRIEGPVEVSREGGQRFSVIETNVEGRDLVGFVNEAKNIVSEQILLPEGYTLVWGGEFENQQRAAARLILVVPVALALISFLLFLTFRSIKQTLIILSNIPFALTGGLLALWFTGEFLSVPASVGFIALLGIAVMNGVVMMSKFNQLKAKGLELHEVVREGAASRLRPVLMTASISAFGLVPLLIAAGLGSEIQKPLAIVVIGGLISSTILTLFLLPVIYQKFHVKEA